MTKNSDASYGYVSQQPTALDLEGWNLPFGGQSFQSPPYFALSASDAAKSPGRSSRHQSSGRSEDAGSPSSSQIVYTPTSSHGYDAYPNDGSDAANEDEAELSKSPLSDSIFSSTTDSSFFLVDYPETGENLPTDRPLSHTVPRPLPAMSGSSGQPSRASSVAKSSTSRHAPSGQWDVTTSATGGTMAQNVSGPPNDAFDDQQLFAFASDSYDSRDAQDSHYELMTGLAMPGDDASDRHRNLPQSSLRAFDDDTQQALQAFPYTAGSPFSQTAPPAQQHYFAPQYQRSQNVLSQPQMLQQQPPATTTRYVPTGVPTTPLPIHYGAQASRSFATPITQAGNMPIRSQPSRIVVHQPQQSMSNRAAPYPGSYLHPTHQVATHSTAAQRRTPSGSVVANTSIAPSRRVHLAPREDVRLHVVPSNAHAVTSQAGVNRKGGRARHTHLSDDVRQQTSKMRGVTACWRCALQRDKV